MLVICNANLVQINSRVGCPRVRDHHVSATLSHPIQTLVKMTSKSPTETALCYLKDHNLTVVTAESCTAGLVASTFAEMPGCGSCLDSAFVVYSPESKMQLLGIDRKVLEKNNLTSGEQFSGERLGASQRTLPTTHSF